MKGQLEERQAILQHRLRHNRTKIALRLQPIESVARRAPRSLTMLYFRRHPGLATRLLRQGATLLVGGRLLRFVSMALLVSRAVRGPTTD